MAVVLAAGIAVDSGKLGEWAERLLQLQVSGVTGVRQLESGRDYNGATVYRTAFGNIRRDDPFSARPLFARE